MSNPDSDAEKIRLKRLAKLGGPSPLTSSPQSPAPALDKASIFPTPQEAAMAATPSVASSASTSENKQSVVTLPTQSERPVSTRGEDRISNTAPPKKLKHEEASSPVPVRNVNAVMKVVLTPEQWEDKILGQVFRISLQPNGGHSNGHHFLEKLYKELEDEGQPERLSVTILDQAILSYCSQPHMTITIFDYLISCWKRATHLQLTMKTGTVDEHKAHVFSEAKRMALCYVEYCITMPEMFEDADASVVLYEKLKIDPDEDGGIPNEVLHALITKFEEEPALEEAFRQTIEDLSVDTKTLNINGIYRPNLNALRRILSYKTLAQLFVQSPKFLPDNIEAATFEKETLLGPFFNLHALDTTVITHYYSGLSSRSQTHLSDTARALRLTMQNIQDELLNNINILIRASPEARQRVLDWFAKVLNLNHKRTAIQNDPLTLTGDGFMLNLTAVLTRLCEPFMDAAYSKIDRIDIEYLRRLKCRLDIEEETKLNSTESTAKEYYSNKVEGESNFITEIFFLTVAAHYYGLGAAQTKYESLGRDLQDLDAHLRRMEAERTNWLTSPQLPIYDRQVSRLKARLESGTAYQHAVMVILSDTIVQARTLVFIQYQAAWMIRMVSPDRKYPHTKLKLPLPENPPEHFNHLPEYFVENVGTCIGFIGRYIPNIVVGPQVEEFMVFCIVFLQSSSYVHNPHLKSKLVEILYYGIQPSRMRPASMLGDVLNGHPFALEYLMHALMSFYIEIESQYYQKFTVRYHISEIIKRMWINQAYRDKLEQESKVNNDFFVRFVALLLNDVTYVMDNSLTSLVEIHKLQTELESPEAENLTDEERAEKTKSLQKAEKDASAYMSLGNETVAMLKLFTSAIAGAFVQPEIVHRLAGMLDYNLESLVGPRGSNLKVKNKEKYGFHPRSLLLDFSQVYLNLKHKPAFIEAIAKDGRSYKPSIFTRLIELLRKLNLRGRDELDEIKKLAADVEEVFQADQAGEEELGEIPDEFLDPLMAELMTDPVILPTSNQTVDRSTIKSYLLSDPRDPFNRAPLKIEDVTPNTELKAQIDAFIQEKRNARRHAAEAAINAAAAESAEQSDTMMEM